MGKSRVRESPRDEAPPQTRGHSRALGEASHGARAPSLRPCGLLVVQGSLPASAASGEDRPPASGGNKQRRRVDGNRPQGNPGYHRTDSMGPIASREANG